jgi:hypothetical protein
MHINIPIDLKKFAIIIEFIDLNLPNVINGLLVGIIFLHLTFLVFSTILRILQYQVWKLYLYYRHKNYYNDENDFYKRVPLIIKFECNWSYQHFCLRVALFMQKFLIKYKFKPVGYSSRYTEKLNTIFRYLVFAFIFIFFFLECYFNHGIIEYTKFYLLFSGIFVLWYKFSMFFQYYHPYIDQLLYEREYCFPDIVYVNVTEEEERVLEIYKDKPYLVIMNDLLKWDKITPDIHFYKRFRYVSAENLALLKDEGRGPMKEIKEEYIYANWDSLKAFAKEHLIVKEGNRCYVEEKNYL